MGSASKWFKKDSEESYIDILEHLESSQPRGLDFLPNQVIKLCTGKEGGAHPDTN